MQEAVLTALHADPYLLALCDLEAHVQAPPYHTVCIHAALAST